MDVGMFGIFSSYGWEKGTDTEMWQEELNVFDISANSCFDCLWSTEHHFNDYLLCINVFFLRYVVFFCVYLCSCLYVFACWYVFVCASLFAFVCI